MNRWMSEEIYAGPDGAPAAMFLQDLAGSLTGPGWLEDLVPERADR